MGKPKGSKNKPKEPVVPTETIPEIGEEPLPKIKKIHMKSRAHEIKRWLEEHEISYQTKTPEDKKYQHLIVVDSLAASMIGVLYKDAGLLIDDYKPV